jgi:hypothetical protein
MKYGKAIQILTRDPKANVELVTRDATGNWYVSFKCCLDNGVLVHSHPTQDRGSVVAPLDGIYR